MTEEAPQETPQEPPVAPVPSVEDATPAEPPAQSTPTKDTVMLDAPNDRNTSPSRGKSPGRSPGRKRSRSRTPARGSRAASAHPDPTLAIPTEAAPHGDATRRYLNTKVTGPLLDGMKQLAKDKPNDPLRVLGEYLIQRSKESEGTS
ncbi:hypothetical protein N3K66_007325 [Trichothecium roseum]|uniref:Uncharacterized protein n=1 Tax=Trichothecium roseum TaxID=47278 RepID=A0ACC0UTK3_9HYPO|nr:hypothetical protein N3K66_007325 [Trichothecium roseum]